MSPDGPPLLEARNIARPHPDGRRWLLDNVSLKIHAASSVSVTGASGSGKTLLLRALAVLDPFDGGQVRWKGNPVSRDGIPAFRRQAIYLHQRPAMLDENVETALRRPFLLTIHRGRQFDRGHIVQRLEQLGRGESFLLKHAADLSGGEMQIVALLRALQLDPCMLLLDEPTASLDSSTTSAVEKLLEHWLGESPRGRSVVWITHDAEQARRVAQRTLLMEHGKLTETEG